MRDLLEASARRSAIEIEEMSGVYPHVSFVIRTHNEIRNNSPGFEGLFEDIHRQAFGGEVQIVLADEDSDDGTANIARSLARNIYTEVAVVSVSRQRANYASALNQAIEATDHPYIVSIVGHERLSNTRTLDAVIRGARSPNFGGAYGPDLPNANASRTEQIGAIVLGIPEMLRWPRVITKPEMGMMASDRAVISKAVWQDLGGYDERYGAGGEDGDLGRRMLAEGLSIVRDPVLAMHHTHGLGPIRSLLQLADWFRISRPRPH